MSDISIYHNPKCGTSSETLVALIEQMGQPVGHIAKATARCL
jgi:arsenate reductase-like glutaredoxin family protein